MATSDNLAATLATSFEGFSSAPYRDPVGVWTIGYGSTRDSFGEPVTGASEAISEASARQLLSRDMHAAFEALAVDVKVPLTTFQRAALGDFVYNLGAGNFRSSTLLRKLNAGDYAGAAAEIDKWDQAGGKVLAGLLRRRQAETKLFQAK